ncbi:ISAs1 family transposase [Streptomyces cellulosae]|uniref:ISAs1 family transposase n=1 Tax=Streptomyces cellulosae TaxID=1968 RepID=UPI001F20283B
MSQSLSVTRLVAEPSVYVTTSFARRRGARCRGQAASTTPEGSSPRTSHSLLYAQLKTLPWDKATAKFYDRSHGHGRLETRVVQVMTVTALGVDFPHAAQVAKIVRHRTCMRTGKRTRETVYVLTDLTSRQPSPERLAMIVRSQWTIENRLHFVRDTTFTEDASKVRTGHGPENMATLRSFAINQLRAAGHVNIAAGLREMSYDSFRRPLDLLGLA